MNNKRQFKFAVIFMVTAIFILNGCGSTLKRGYVNSDRKVALIIGNSAYKHTTPLTNPVNDASGLSRELRKMGFDVIEGKDLNGHGMVKSLSDFERRAKKADVALFFYAGHGLQVSGQNYLVPVDASFSQTMVSTSGLLESQTITLNKVLKVLNNGPKTTMVMIDACRDNPLTSKVVGNGENQRALKIIRKDKKGRELGMAHVNRGLAQVEASNSRNLLIAFATQPGNVALDGKNDINSPFTKALLNHLPTPGIEVREMLTRVRKEVMANTGGKQIPWDQSSLTSPYNFLEARKRTAPPP